MGAPSRNKAAGDIEVLELCKSMLKGSAHEEKRQRINSIIDYLKNQEGGEANKEEGGLSKTRGAYTVPGL